MMSAPARMNPRWSERTLSGARMFASSGQRSRATALDTSVPIPPSPTSGGPSASRSRKRPDMARPVYAGGEVTLSTHFGGAVKRLRVTPAAGELRRLRSLTTGSDAAAARVRSLRGEGAVPPSEELAGDGEAGAWRLPRSVPCSLHRSRFASANLDRATPRRRSRGRSPRAGRELTFDLSSGRPGVPIATATPGWGLTAISSGPEPPRKGRRTTPPFLCARSETRSREFLIARTTNTEIPKGRRFAAAGASAKRPCGGSEIGS